MKQDRADLDPPQPRSATDNGHVWMKEQDFLDHRPLSEIEATCLYCGCAQTAKEATELCRNIGSEKRLA